jgi:ribosomal protein L17
VSEYENAAQRYLNQRGGYIRRLKKTGKFFKMAEGQW